jgi:ERCC4-type nuclease
MELIVDSREHLFVNNILLEQHKVENLEVGDFLFRYKETGKKICLIERKTIEDYASSITDKRNKNQMFRIQEMKGENPDLIVIYLIEGNMPDSDKKFYGGVTGDAIFSSICNKIIRDNVYIFQVQNMNKDVYQSIRFLNNLYKKFNDKVNNNNENNSVNYNNTIKLQKKDMMNPTNWYICSLAQIPSVSIEMATLISSKYPSLLNLIDLLKQSDGIRTLSNILYGNRRIGDVIANRIYEYLEINKNQSNIVEPPTIKKLKLKTNL